MNELNSKNYAIFTVCNLAYLPKALVLAESVYKFNNVKLTIYLIEKKIDIDTSTLKVAVDITWIEDLDIPDFYDLAFKYDIIELSTAVKPYISLKILERFEKVIFLDPDTCLYHSVAPILADLDNHSIVLTPHYTTPQPDHASESDLGMMRFGSFNLGFFAVRHSDQGTKFLEWWSNRCFQFCYMESQFGLSTDQKWVSIAPCFFQDLYVSFNLGYNAAPWNSYERSISKTSDGTYIVNNTYPLIFFHFSNFNPLDLDYFNKRSTKEKGIRRPDLHELSFQYNKSLIEHTTSAASVKYGFDYMSNGEYVSPTLRRAYACISSELPVNTNPFDSLGPVGTFAKQNHLFEKQSSPFKTNGFADLEKNRFQLKIINIVFRILLRLVGPNKFYNFSRLLVYMSSYRQNRDLWKFEIK